MGSGLPELFPGRDVVGEQDPYGDLPESDPELISLGAPEANPAGIQPRNPDVLQIPLVLGRYFL